MTSGRARGSVPQELDIRQIIREAQLRWLKPPEVCEILRNFQNYGFQLNPVPPNKPDSGSLFLFDRKALRYFRKDGHNWRKKKDGKTVREAHERLKAGSVDVLHCYYAHGEEDQSFQRRSYWMLDPAHEHIVLVHYLQVNQGNRPGSYRAASVPLHVSPSASSAMSPDLSSMSPIMSPEMTVSSEVGDVDSSDDVEEIVLPPSKPQPTLLHQLSKDWSSIFAENQNFEGSGPFSQSQQAGQLPDDLDDLLNNPDKYLGPKPLTPAVSVDNSGWNEMLRAYHSTQPALPTQPDVVTVKEEMSWQQTYEQCTTPGTRDALLGQASPMKLDALRKNSIPSPPANVRPKAIMEVLSPRGLGREPQTALEAQLRAATEQNALRSGHSPTKQRWQGSELSQNVDIGRASQTTGTQQTSWSNTQPTPAWQEPRYGIGASAENLKKNDSFGRWLTQALGDDSPGALIAPAPSDSGSFWIPDESSTAETTGLSSQMQLDMSISISQVQRFSITDFSPDSAFANEDVKVLVSGIFLDSVTNPLDFKWCCMFGDAEVPAELINVGVLRCKVPPHSPGRVPFYITCSDRLACSEVREFEIRSRLEEVPGREDTVKELLLELRLLRMLSPTDANDTGEWESLEKDIKSLTLGESAVKERLLQLCFKDRFQRWLSTSENPCAYNEHGQGLLHLVSALGYDWAIKPIVEAGVVPNFRDSRGWTALHWAATFGRETTILALLAAGTRPSLVTDPTAKHPNGQMASDLASASGHKGIAGYLAEKALACHLSSLTIVDNNLSEITSVSATLEGDNAMQNAAQHTVGLEDSADAMSAVRKATTAAALIHSAYRIDSFRKRSMDEDDVADEYGMFPGEIQAIQRATHRQQEQSAALHIQRKFRGWKGRKEFLNLRKHVVRIQAHIRGHQARKQFKKVLRVVSVIEKAVLRWRRKRVGLRGWQTAETNGVNSDDDDFLKEARKQKEKTLEKAVTRVLSMAGSEQGREQYGRMVHAENSLSADSDQLMTVVDADDSTIY